LILRYLYFLTSTHHVCDIFFKDFVHPNNICNNSGAGAIQLESAVGWPPVHTSRRNLVTAMHTTKSDGTGTVDGPKGITVPRDNEKEENSTGIAETRPLPTNMFAKVHMEGYAIARKVNLRAHGSYDSLSQVLTKMTRNFFCRKCIIPTEFVMPFKVCF
jgi:auxin-responsive protein IAA